jgi:hypothetical protein
MKKGTFKTFITKQTDEFASINGGQILTSTHPQCVFESSATMEDAEKFFPSSVLQYVDLIDVEYQVKE